jgi:hypothetical protein
VSKRIFPSFYPITNNSFWLETIEGGLFSEAKVFLFGIVFVAGDIFVASVHFYRDLSFWRAIVADY